jgi:diadenosine tetraphosphate (Ap4A) HIT family hydrolase
MTSFHLDPRLEADTAFIADLPVSTVRLMRDANYPWVILIPRRAGLVELTDLAVGDRHALLDEITLVGDALRAETHCLKLNVAAIGNMVRQLHVHVVARFEGDAAWPRPVWAQHPPLAYAELELVTRVNALASRLGRC